MGKHREIRWKCRYCDIQKTIHKKNPEPCEAGSGFARQDKHYCGVMCYPSWETKGDFFMFRRVDRILFYIGLVMIGIGLVGLVLYKIVDFFL